MLNLCIDPLFSFELSFHTAAYLVGGFANAPETAGWRPNQLRGGKVNPDGLILVAELSPNAAGFKDGIIATPPEDRSLIISRVKGTASQILAPPRKSLLRRISIGTSSISKLGGCTLTCSA